MTAHIIAAVTVSRTARMNKWFAKDGGSDPSMLCRPPMREPRNARAEAPLDSVPMPGEIARLNACFFGDSRF